MIDVLGGLRSRLHARNESALLLQVLRDVDRVEDDRRVEVGEEHDQNRLQQVVEPGARLEVFGDDARVLIAAELRDRTRNDDHR